MDNATEKRLRIDLSVTTALLNIKRLEVKSLEKEIKDMESHINLLVSGLNKNHKTNFIAPEPDNPLPEVLIDYNKTQCIVCGGYTKVIHKDRICSKTCRLKMQKRKILTCPVCGVKFSEKTSGSKYYCTTLCAKINKAGIEYNFDLDYALRDLAMIIRHWKNDKGLFESFSKRRRFLKIIRELKRQYSEKGSIIDDFKRRYDAKYV